MKTIVKFLQIFLLSFMLFGSSLLAYEIQSTDMVIQAEASEDNNRTVKIGFYGSTSIDTENIGKFTGNVFIDWGDETSSVVVYEGKNSNLGLDYGEHNYTENGLYTISMHVSKILVSDNKASYLKTYISPTIKITGPSFKKLVQFGKDEDFTRSLTPYVGHGSFSQCTELVIDASDPLYHHTESFTGTFTNVKEITSVKDWRHPSDARGTFEGVTKLADMNEYLHGQYGYLSDMTGMFRDANMTGQTLNSTEWCNNGPKKVSNLFRGTNFNGDIGCWNVSGVTHMDEMFTDAVEFNQDISSWNTANVITWDDLFHGASKFNQPIGTWKINEKNTDFSYLFSEALAFNQDLSAWDMSNVTSISGMFNTARSFNQSISAWNLAKIGSLRQVFTNAISFNHPSISDLNTSNVSSFDEMFRGATSFNQDIGNWDTSKAATMTYMFRDATSFNQDISSWDTSKVTTMRNMFFGATIFNQNLAPWNFESIKAHALAMEFIFVDSNLSHDNYGNILKSISEQDVLSGVKLDADNRYCWAGIYHDKLLNDKGWYFDDGGLGNPVAPQTTTSTVTCRDEPTLRIDIPDMYIFAGYYLDVGDNTPKGSNLGAMDIYDKDDAADDPYQVFSIDGGDDASKFTVEGRKLILNFEPDFDNPVDKNRDNLYKITIKVFDSDGSGNTFTQNMTIKILKVYLPEITSPTPVNTTMYVDSNYYQDFTFTHENPNQIPSTRWKIYTYSQLDRECFNYEQAGIAEVNTNRNPLYGTYYAYSTKLAFFDDAKGGELDLVMGAEDGTLKFYKYENGTYVEAEHLYNSIDVGDFSAPAFVDLSNNGEVTLFVGDANGTITQYNENAEVVSPSYTQGIDVGDNAVPAFVNIDDSVDKELFVGDANGTIHYFVKLPGATSYQEERGAANPFDGVDVGDDAAPTFKDIDGDGDMDAVVGNSLGKIKLFLNTGTASAAEFRELSDEENIYSDINIRSSITPIFADITGDGNSKLFVANKVGRIFQYNYYAQAGVIGKPSESCIGVHDINLTLTDGTTELYENYQIEVVNVPDIDTLLYTLYESEFYSYIDENELAVTTFRALDKNNAGGITFEIVGGANVDTFDLNSTTGELKLKTAANFEAGSSVYHIEVKISDESGASRIKKFAYALKNVNEAPLWSASPIFETNEDTNKEFDLENYFNDPDVDDSFKFRFLDSNDSSLSAFKLNDHDKTLNVTPYANKFGDINLTLQVIDSGGLENTTSIIVRILPVNDLPIIEMDENLTLLEDTSDTMNFSLGDVEDASTTFSIDENTSNGTIEIISGKLVYVPNANFFGIDTFKVKSVDSDGGVAYKTVTINVTNINDNPIITIDENLTTSEDVNISTTYTFVDVDEDNVTSTEAVPPQNGTIIIAGTTITYIPKPNFFGKDKFTISMTDNHGYTTQKVINVTVTPVDDIAVWHNALIYNYNEDSGTHSIELNATDDDFDTIAYSFTSSSSTTATLSIAGGNLIVTTLKDVYGQVLVDLNATSNGISVILPVVINILSVNDAPVIETIFADTNIVEDIGTIKYAIKVSDIEGDDLNLTIDSNDTSILRVTPNWVNKLNEATYAADPNTLDFNVTTVENASGKVQLTITLKDNNETVTKTFNINVIEVNDAPIIASIVDVTKEMNFTKFAVDVNVTDAENDALEINATTSSGLITLDVISGVASDVVVVESETTSSGADSSKNGQRFIWRVDNLLAQVWLKSYNNQSDKYVYIYKALASTATSGDYLAQSNDKILASKKVNFVDGQSGTPTKVIFDTPVQLINGQEYAIVVSADTNYLYYNANGTYGGIILETGNDTSGDHLYFELYSGDVNTDLGYGNKQINISSVTGKYGTAQVQVAAKDVNGGSSTESFDVIIPLKTTFTGLNGGNIELNEDFKDYTVTISDVVGTDFKDVNLSLALSDGSIVETIPSWTNPLTSADYNGTDFNITIRSKANMFGTTDLTATLVLSDGSEAENNSTININVLPINDAPILDALSDITKDEDFIAFDVTASASDVDTGDTLTYSITSTDATLATVTNTANVIHIAPIANKFGITQIAMKVDDGNLSVTKSFNFVVNSINDIATITGTSSGSSIEDNATISKGTLSVDDNDTAESTFIAQPSVVGKYGTFTLASDGNWTYSVDNSNPVIQAMIETDSLSETFDVASLDSTATQTITVTITGVNGTALIAGSTSATAYEDSTNVTTAKLIVKDEDTNQSTFVAQTDVDGLYGKFSLTIDGVWTYILDSAKAIVQALRDSEFLEDIFNVLSFDGSADQNVTIKIQGTNDVAIIDGTFDGNATEDNSSVTSGTLNVTDVDNDEAFFVAQNATSGVYGVFTLATDGNWTYTLDNSRSDVQALPEDTKLTDIFSVATVDGTMQNIEITITGVNGDANITGVNTGASTEDVIAAISAKLDVADEDTKQANFIGQARTAGAYGIFTLSSDGSWTYTLDNSLSTIQALPKDTQLTDTFTVISNDGTANQTVTITITGVNGAATISGTATGTSTEDTTVETTGKLVVKDEDTNEANFVEQTAISGSYGTFNLSADGSWRYTLDSSLDVIQALPEGTKVTEMFSVTTIDGTQREVSITIVGINGVAVITGTSRGSVTEDTSATATGTLKVADEDTAQAFFVTQNLMAGNYGLFSVTSAGAWKYMLDDTNRVVQELALSVEITDVFEVVSGDDSAKYAITITIVGTNDEPTITIASELITDEDNTKAMTFDFEDIDGDTVSGTINTQATHGVISISGTTITYVPVANYFGQDSFKINMTDSHGFTTVKIIDVTVNPVDDAPILTTISDQVEFEDSASIQLSLETTDIDNNNSEAIYTVQSLNESVAQAKIIIVDGVAKLLLIPAENATGIVDINVTTTLGGQSDTKVLHYTLKPINDAPTIESIEDIYFEQYEEVQTMAIDFSIWDDVNVETLTKTLTIQNAKLLKDVTISNTETSATFTFEVQANESGIAHIVLTATDEENLTYNESFNIVVKPSNNALCVEDTKTALTFDMIKNANVAPNYIATQLGFPNTLESICPATITWKISNTNVINENGDVTVGQVDQTVAAIATITKGEYVTTKQFLLTVPKAQITASDALAELTFDLIKYENYRSDKIATRLNLVSTSLGKAIVWTGDNDSVIDPYTGVVTRGSVDENVTLSATIDGVTKTFTLLVLANPLECTQIIAKDREWLNFTRILGDNRDNSNVIYNLAKPLPSDLETPNKSSIVWSSTNEAVVTEQGDVFRDELEDKFIILTATLSNCGETSSKEFLIRVLKNEIKTSTNETIFSKMVDTNRSISVNFKKDATSTEDVNTTADFAASLASVVENIISEDSVKAIFELLDRVVNLYLNTNGTTESKAEFLDENNNSVVSSIKVDVPQSQSTVDENGTVETVVEVDSNTTQRTTVKAELLANGFVKHVVSAEDANSTKTTTTASANVKGAKVNVDDKGEVQTSVEVSEGGYIFRAIAVTAPNGETVTRFEKISKTDVTDVQKRFNTFVARTPYDAGNEVEINKLDGVLYIQTISKLSDKRLTVE